MFRSHSIARWPGYLATPTWRLLLLAAVLILGVAQPLGVAAAESPINLQAPGAPAHVHATAADDAALLSWAAPYDNGSIVATRVVPGNTTTLRWISVDSPFLKPGVPYTFTVLATNAFGNGPPSKPSNSITWVPGVSPPGQPQNLTAAAGNGSATLRWAAPDNGGSEIVGYEIAVYRGQNLFDWKLLPDEWSP